jgi:hypothetical protein
MTWLDIPQARQPVASVSVAVFVVASVALHAHRDISTMCAPVAFPLEVWDASVGNPNER